MADAAVWIVLRQRGGRGGRDCRWFAGALQRKREFRFVLGIARGRWQFRSCDRVRAETTSAEFCRAVAGVVREGRHSAPARMLARLHAGGADRSEMEY